MSVSTTSTTAATERTAPKTESEQSEISPEFKEAMESLELYFDEYIDFMKLYKENPTDLGLLSEYTAHLQKYTEAMNKMNSLKSDSLSDSELKYYIEVTARINKKLIDATLTASETTAVSKSEEPIITETAEEVAVSAPKTETQSNSASGINQDFKEAMDSLEAYFDEYCRFMKKYKENPTDLSLLAEYSNHLQKYADAMNRMNALKSDDLTNEELKYYIEVTSRINQKLLDAAL